MDVNSCHLLFDHFQFILFHWHNIPDSHAILFLTTSDFTSITSHIHSWLLFSLWLCLFILFAAVSPLFCNSILGTYRRGGVHLSVSYLFAFSYYSWDSQAKIVKWFAIQWQSSGPHFVNISLEVKKKEFLNLSFLLNLLTKILPYRTFSSFFLVALKTICRWKIESMIIFYLSIFRIMNWCSSNFQLWQMRAFKYYCECTDFHIFELL